jgi:hypothetical protein
MINLPAVEGDFAFFAILGSAVLDAALLRVVVSHTENAVSQWPISWKYIACLSFQGHFSSPNVHQL